MQPRRKRQGALLEAQAALTSSSDVTGTPEQITKLAKSPAGRVAAVQTVASAVPQSQYGVHIRKRQSWYGMISPVQTG